jgi:MFS family permease
VLFGGAVMVAPALLVALSASRWLPLCVGLLVAMGVAESGFATMQSTLVLLEAPERIRGAAMGILSACIGTQPLGTLAIGAIAGTLGAPRAFAINAIAALAVIAPVAIPLVRGRVTTRRWSD